MNYKNNNAIAIISRFIAMALIPLSTMCAQSAIAETTPTPGMVKKQLGSKPADTIQPTLTLPPQKPRSNETASEQRLRIKQIKFQGQTVYTNRQLNNIIESYLKPELTLTEIYGLAQKVTRFYRENGYILATVSLPAQKISNNTVILEVIEGKIEDINFTGNHRFSDEFLRQQIPALTRESTLGKTIKSDELEGALISLSDLPGLSARASIEPGDTFGTADINIETNENPLNASLQLNNHGRKSLGTYQLLANADVNNPFHLADQIRLNAAIAPDNRLSYINGQYSLQAASDGSRAGLSVSHFTYDVDTSELSIANTSAAVTTLSGNGNTYRLFYSYPWIRTLADMRTFEFALRRTETSQKGTLALLDAKDDSIDLVEMTLRGQKDHQQGTTMYHSVLTTNFDQADNSNLDSGQRANLLIDITHKHIFDPRWILSGRSLLSYSPDDLTDTERFRLGGHDTVRAYPAAEIAGDYGLLISADIDHHFVIKNNALITASLFFDAGKVYQHSPSLGEAKGTQISGVGAGIALNTKNNMSANLDFAYPLSDLDTSDGNKAHLWASLSITF